MPVYMGACVCGSVGGRSKMTTELTSDESDVWARAPNGMKEHTDGLTIWCVLLKGAAKGGSVT
jgi:hypothetical protein